MSFFSRALAYSNFAFGLREFLKEPVTLEKGREILRQRLQNRELNFLAIVQKAIYENKASPYLQLLELAACEYGDFKKLIISDGIESALKKLYEAGVYVSIDEFKCKKAMVRGSRSFTFRESDFDNPFLLSSLEAKSSGSRSSGTKVIMNFERYYYLAADNAVVFDAHGIYGSPVILWQPILPSTAGLPTAFRSIKMGSVPLRWFSPVESKTIKPSLSKRLATYYAVYASRFFGVAFPKPEYVNYERADIIVDFIAEVLKGKQGCILWTTPSAAVRICQLAREKGMDMSGTTFGVAGEPLTRAKRTEIGAVGAKVISMYAAAEVGVVGFGCAGRVDAPDDIHLFKDIQAVIQHRREVNVAGASVDAFLFTSMLHKAPKILLNVESGDYGVIASRQCGCKIEEYGLTDHIYNIRSFDKLTGAGMTFAGTDILRIIEEVLPAKYGGTSTDYQMVEEEDEAGHTRLTISISPEVGEIDEQALVRIVVAELSRGNDVRRMMTDMWSQAAVLRVKRERPYITAGGKLLPLHIQKQKKT
jgi:hypothetical protein